MTPLNLDVSGDEARALHRVVRAMHDGHCPKCGHLGRSEEFFDAAHGNHVCPSCWFSITRKEAAAALQAFQKYLDLSVEIFENWQKGLL